MKSIAYIDAANIILSAKRAGVEIDFVKLKNVSVATRYCSRKIVEIARSEEWTGFAVGCMIDGFPLPDLSCDDWDAELVVAVAGKFKSLDE